MIREPHPFARFINILGRGRTLTRSLTIAEAEEAMAMILAGDVLPEQLGAFLLLLRVKEESPEEIAGFVRAARRAMQLPCSLPRVDLDWSSYAGKRRQLPWFILSALILARNGWRVFMHGAEGHTIRRIYAREVLVHLGLPVANNFDEAAAHLVRHNFAYLPLERISTRLADMMNLRSILGLRSPVHTFARMLNPFGARCVLQGVFHPGYMELHRRAGLLLAQPHLAVFRGEGGEIERRPNKPCEVLTAHDQQTSQELWEPIIPDPRQAPDEDMDLACLGAMWRGEIEDEYAVAAITGTVAIALKALDAETDQAQAQARAEDMWNTRDRGRLAAVA
jgi:anthranilate phosphoribosyltransferase